MNAMGAVAAGSMRFYVARIDRQSKVPLATAS